LADSDEATGERDTTSGEVVSDAYGTIQISDQPAADTGGGDGTKAGRRAGRIRRVRASHQNLTLAHYLGLPYGVAVKSEREGEQTCWSATVEELPGCTVRAETPDEAVELLRPAMEQWLQAALAEDREIPVPGSETAKRPSSSSHSGRFLVRMPGTLHTQLARAAEREQLSLNRFVTKVLASSVSPKQPTSPRTDTHLPETAAQPANGPKREPSRALRVALATNLAVVVFAGLAAIVLLVLAVQSGF
jgi:antitoxin HicB